MASKNLVHQTVNGAEDCDLCLEPWPCTSAVDRTEDRRLAQATNRLAARLASYDNEGKK